MEIKRFIPLHLQRKNIFPGYSQFGLRLGLYSATSAGREHSPARHDASALCFVTITLYLGYFTASVSRIPGPFTRHAGSWDMVKGKKQRPWSGGVEGEGHTWLRIKDSCDQRSQQSTAPHVDRGESAAGDPVSIMVNKHTPLQ